MQIRDSRPRNFFWCDNIIIDQYARRLGPYALSVYMALLRHADQGSQSCYPSLNTLAEELAMSKPSVLKAISTLKKHKLIAVRHRRAPAGDAASNLYILRGVVNDVDHVVNQADHRGQRHLPPVVNDVDPNNTQGEQHTQNKGEAAFLALKMNGAYGLCAACRIWHQPGPCPS